MKAAWMGRNALGLTITLAAALTAAACSNHVSPSSSAARSRASAAATASLGSACKRRLLTAADVAGVLHAPSTAEEIPGDNGSTCSFTTADYASLSVTLRAGMGKTSLAIWKSGKMPVSGVAEPGVGDEAVWVEGLHEVVARKNDLLCDIQVSGLDRNAPGASHADQRRAVGALCNKIFAAAP
jgi:hypothetical protein